MKRLADFRIRREPEDLLIRWVGESTQHLTTGIDQEETTHEFNYEVATQGRVEVHFLRISDFVVARAMECGIDLLNDPSAADALFVEVFSKAEPGLLTHVVSFFDLDVLRRKGKGKVQ